MKSLMCLSSAAIVVLVGCAQTQNAAPKPARIAIESEADMPRADFTISKLPSALVLTEDAAYGELVDALQADTDRVLAQYDIKDPGAKRALLTLKHGVLMDRQQWPAALKVAEQIQRLAQKPAERQMSGLVSNAFARAAIDTKQRGGPAFARAFEGHFRRRLAQVDVPTTRNQLEALRGQMQVLNPTTVENLLKGQLDGLAKQSKMIVGRQLAGAFVAIKQTTRLLALTEVIGGAIGDRLAEVPEAVAVDKWADRETRVSAGSPVVVAVWDSGVDSDLQGARAWKNPSKGGPGFAHGIAFGPDFSIENTDLLVEAENYSDRMGELLDMVKGLLDLRAGLETAEKTAFVSKMSSMGPEESLAFQKALTVVSNYIHGQHVADIAVEGNAQAQIMNVRFTWPTDPIPKKPMDEAYARDLVRAAKIAVAFMKDHKVRVVNMSWRITRPMVEALLQITGAEPDAKARQARAARIFEIMQVGLTEAFDSAPEILFVAGAGNEDENVEFVSSVPAGINRPNVMTVGAVDKALQPAGFTSYGDAIDVYANGFEVSGRVPGGRVLKLSGTSMAAPQVTNLAGKLFATKPTLTVEQARAAIEKMTTQEGEQALKVIHPAKSLSAVVN